MNIIIRVSSALAFLAAMPGFVAAQEHPPMPAGMSHAQHLERMKDDELKKRGAAAMGFDQDKTSHPTGDPVR
jgi:hypothetical protein